MSDKKTNPADIKLEDDDYKMLTEMESFKNKFFSTINRGVLVSKLADIIDDVDGLSFKTERAKKHINVVRPRYVLDIDQKLIDMPKREFDALMYDEISSKYTSWLTKASSNNKDISAMMETLREKYGDVVKSYVVNVTLAYHIDKKDKNLVISYII